jgi:hypothetical protein
MALWAFVREPRFLRAVRILAVLCLFDRAVFWVSDAWWQHSVGFGALWRARQLAVWSLFLVVLAVGGAALATSRRLLAMPVLSAPEQALLEARAPTSLLHALVLWASRRAAWVGLWTWAAVIAWAAWCASGFGDEWLLWRSSSLVASTSALGSEPISGRPVAEWVFARPLWSPILHIAFRTASLWLLVALLLLGAQTLVRQARASSKLREAGTPGQGWVWCLGALWWALWALGQAEALWALPLTQRIEDGGHLLPEELVGAGWSWLSWNFTLRFSLAGAALGALLACACLARAWGSGRRPGMQQPSLVFRKPLFWVCVGVLACLGPGILNRLASPLAWRLALAPNGARLEETFLQAHRAATRRAWGVPEGIERRVDVETQGGSSGTTAAGEEAAQVLAGARLWDESTGHAALALEPLEPLEPLERDESVSPSLNRDGRGRPILVSRRGVYDAGALSRERPPLIRPISARPTALTSPRGPLLEAVWRLLWVWRGRSPSVLWRGTGVPVREAREALALLLPRAQPGGLSLMSDGSQVLDVLLVAQWPGSLSLPLLDASSHASCEWAKLRLEPGGGLAFFTLPRERGQHAAWRAAWDGAFGVRRPFSQMAGAARREVRYPKPLLEAQLRAEALASNAERALWSSAEPSSSEFAPTPRGFALQQLETEGERVASLLEVGCEAASYGSWTRWLLGGSPSLRALDLAVGAEEVTFEDGRVKARRVRGKVWVVLRSDGALARLWMVQPLGWESVESAQGVRRRVVRLDEVALSNGDVRLVGRGSDLASAWRDWRRQLSDASRGDALSPSAASAPVQELAREGVRLHDQAQQAARRNQWQRAGELWRRERELLRSLTRPSATRGTAPAPTATPLRAGPPSGTPRN